ncbi:hypothetical protein [Jidongwangia harbinensis]|uniref:hypothetical protein n=1 Tax=Jidongwangia harbinensis TaxID=2878561 RepID=UPI002343183F|nr:hypothetical protein [Jidongwangia harbinensis]
MLTRTGDQERPTAPAPVVPRVPRRPLRLVPGALVLCAAVVLLRGADVGLGVQARFAGHLLVVVLIPGVLLWRSLRGGPGPLPVDLVGGATLGYVLEIGWYLLGRAAGFPYLHVVAAGAGIVAFLAVPGLRRYWRGSGRPADVRWSISVAALCLALVGWAAVTYWAPHGLAWPGSAHPYPDMVFHQSLAAELRHHLPPQSPSVAGVPLSYHWFVHADWAAASWSTGIEPQLLTYRLGLLPVVVLFVVGIAAVAQRVLPGRWWTGPLTAVLALGATALDPAGWSVTEVPVAAIPATMWLSPSQTLGGLLFAGVLLSLVDLRDPGGRSRVGSWVVFGLAVLGATGAKATYAPLLVAGLLSVLAVGLLRRRFETWAAAAAGLTVAAFAVVALTMFRGSDAGVFPAPFASVRGSAAAGGHLGLGLAAWALAWSAVAAAVVLLVRRRGWTDPMLVLSAGLATGALAVVLSTQQMGGSETYFLTSARPYVALLVVAALVACVPAGGVRRPDRLVVAAALVGGAVVTMAAEWLSPVRPVSGGPLAVLWPYALPPAVAALAALLLHRPRATRSVALLSGGAVLIGAVLPTSIGYAQSTLQRLQAGSAPRLSSASPVPAAVPRGAVAAGRWLREHSGPDELLATNSHCRFRAGPCDPRQFWLAAYAERRVLVEGWGYTPPANEIAAARRLSVARVPYWDPARLAENDAAFVRPSATTVGLLRTRYGVRWLVVDRTRAHDRAGLDRVARLRYRAGQIAVYQVR